MKILNWPQIFASHPVLSSLDQHCVQRLLREDISTQRSHEPGAVILHEGEASNSIFVIGSGSAEAVLTGSGGENISLSVMREGDIFGEMAFFEGKARSATITACEGCVTLEIKAQEVRRLIDEHPDIGVKLLLTCSERLRNKNSQILALAAAAKQARAEAENANRAKEEFLEVLSRAIRSPRSSRPFTS